MHLQLKDVPDDIHRELRRRAGRSGMSMRDYVLRLIERDQRLPTPEEWLEEVARLEPLRGLPPAAELIREAREERDAELSRRALAGRRRARRRR